MKFIFYDIILLVVFATFVAQFLYRNRKNLTKEGWLFLYKTKWGMKFIDKIGKKYQKTLKVLSYISISIGYILMASMLYLFGKIVYLYITYPNVVRAIKVPPIMPLIPYLPQAFKLDFLPPFYFTYWIVILAIIAITHEFSHGIFMRRYNIKIKSTGFGFFPFFLPVFLAAFVEQDEKSMVRSGKFKQMAVLAAGTFANILTAAFFFIVMWLFFSLSFAPAGVKFNTYSYSIINSGEIMVVNGINLANPTYDQLLASMNEEGFNKIETAENSYLTTKEMIEEQKRNYGNLVLYDDAPAINAELDGAIISIDGKDITDWDDFADELSEDSPGDTIIITTLLDGEEVNYEITLGVNPENSEKPWVGIGYASSERKGIMGRFVSFLSSFKQEYLHYEPKYEAADFIYNMLWWLVLISFSVALVNMLPMGIFDGGRFFYLTILGITKSEKKAKWWFKWVTNFLLLLLVVLMVFWALSFI